MNNMDKEVRKMEGQMTELKYSAEEILRAAIDVGEQILKNGGEIHRVEDTIERICKAYDAQEVEVFSITTLIVASLRMPDGDYSHQIRKIDKTKNNLARVEKMNEISRKLCNKTLEISELSEKIDSIEKEKTYPVILYYIAAMLGAGSFTLLFKGDIMDALCASIAGLLITFADRHIPKFVNPLIATVINSAIGGLSVIALVKLGLGHNMDLIMIGTVMLLIPGLALGNSVRDLMSGDTISGAMRLIQSLLVALMIAAGYAVAIFVMGGVS